MNTELNLLISETVAETLVEMGFRKSSDHESAKDLYFTEVKPGLELEISIATGKGTLFIHNNQDDVSMCDIPMTFEGIGHLYWIIQAFRKPDSPAIFYDSHKGEEA